MKSKLLAATAAVALAIAGGHAASAKTLVYCSEGSPENFYPAINTTGTSFDASARQIYSRLVEFERGTTKIEPGLATSWDATEDGLSFTFHLRKGVKWQTTKNFTPARDFNADDVIFSFDRQSNKDNPWFKVTSDDHEYYNDMDMPKLVKSIDKIDDYTVKFTLNAPEAPFIANMAMDFASIISKEYADQMMKAGTPEKMDQEPVGTGPFQLENYQKDAVIRFKAFQEGWRGKQAIDTLIFAITPDASVRYAKLKANECQVMPYPNPADVAEMKKNPDLKVLEQPGLNVGYLAMNVTKKPFDDKRVRQAVNYAINKPEIIEAVYQGTGIAAKNPIPPTMWSYNDDVKDYPYDPAKAKQLLAEAGLPNGFETDLWWMPVQRPYNPNAKRIGELMQADLDKVGIKAKLVSYEWGEYRKRVANGDPMMAQIGWTGDNGDPDNFLYTLLGCAGATQGGGNAAKWCYKPFDDLLLEAKRTTDIARRTELYRKAQVIFKEEAPWVTIAHAVQIGPTRKEVVGYKLSPFGQHEFFGVDLQ